ncbi:CpxP family protein [Marinomonas sp. C2222]|uniref:CpxP family protein n=1 Tax=Marinomonas sargassi TaxID=2984494 RepID=A0ABT2YTK9_9GAMM|nr:CpxP family protein [Marinomonas sargassi]MCV2403203.1 CpxP family protein [Marinomonas sargassi]
MKATKKFVIAAVTLPLVLGTASAYAFGGKDHKGKDNNCRNELGRGMMKALEITEEQKAEIKELCQVAKEEKRGAKEQQPFDMEKHKQRFEQLNALLLADTFDKSKANAIAQEMAEKHAAQQMSKLEMKFKVLNVLTPEQKAKYVELQEERMAKKAEKKQERRDK